jgi:hypothetical protein
MLLPAIAIDGVDLSDAAGGERRRTHALALFLILAYAHFFVSLELHPL